jgi:hypothetical protein
MPVLPSLLYEEGNHLLMPAARCHVPSVMKDHVGVRTGGQCLFFPPREIHHDLTFQAAHAVPNCTNAARPDTWTLCDINLKQQQHQEQSKWSRLAAPASELLLLDFTHACPRIMPVDIPFLCALSPRNSQQNLQALRSLCRDAPAPAPPAHSNSLMRHAFRGQPRQMRVRCGGNHAVEVAALRQSRGQGAGCVPELGSQQPQHRLVNERPQHLFGVCRQAAGVRASRVPCNLHQPSRELVLAMLYGVAAPMPKPWLTTYIQGMTWRRESSICLISSVNFSNIRCNERYINYMSHELHD